MLLLLLGLVAIVVLVTVYRVGRSLSASIGDGQTAGDGHTTAAAAACPAAAGRWLPGAGSGSELVAQYTTDKHVITVCRDVDGRYHYDGQVRGAEPTVETHISLFATETATGFTADNGDFHYEIDNLRLTVEHSGKVRLSAQLTRIAP